ncbi:MAG: homoserine dehydrogenase [Synergistaceae bacterium]|jgi:homoserine dehydrogenase|nr:homoserine dehydrogenase [Synergistaceae bacterium]
MNNFSRVRNLRLRVGIVGYGNLGRAAVHLLDMKRESWKTEGLELDLTCVLGRRGGLLVPGGLSCGALAEHGETGAPLDCFPGFDKGVNVEEILRGHQIDLLVEFTPTNKETGEPGLTHIRQALKNGIHVTTGNKGPVLVAWKELSQLAWEQGVLLGIGCTTGGALPSLIAGREAMAGSEISLVEGVLNGTTNFILSRMERDGIDYEVALKEAQRNGIAEADPRMDVEGWDTAVKLTILTKVVMKGDLELKDVSVTGITGLTRQEIQHAQETGHRIKLIGRAWRNGKKVRASVAPEQVEAAHPFYAVAEKDKCVRYVSDTLGDLFISGGASGPLSAAASAMRDVLCAWRTGLLAR